ncbi:tetratricopeptide repeat protein [Amycolatopsis sp. cg9]|uniref:tetratricopeptide repeat protein n=1 Tax=Amycolatopsis sp. cg9 TaxID=3238801 RepID=UPI003524CF19
MEAKKHVGNAIDARGDIGTVVQAGTIGAVNLVQPPAGTAVAVVLPVRSDVGACAEVFVGREEETERLSSLLRSGSGSSVSYVAGMGGVGKTALALHCARLAGEAEWFPGGVFSVDMQGYRADGGVPARAILRPLMRLLGVDPHEIPVDVGEQLAAYQQLLDRLGQSGKAVLLVLDNVSTAEQIQGLLPAGDGHRVVLTTRETLDLPGARGFSLGVLTNENARVLLDRAIRDLVSEERRISADPIGTRELIRTCGRLPLALRIVAALLADEPALTPAHLAAELTEAGIVGFAHGERALAAVLDLSWHRLVRRNRAAARLLRLLCLTVGPDCPTEVAAVLNGSSGARTVPLLRTLRQAHLLAHADQRWRMHDLVRAHAETCDAGLSAAEIHAADTRLVDHYVFTAQDAVHHLSALAERPVHNRFTRTEDAVRWLATEYPTLLAVAHKTAESGNHRYTMVLCSHLTTYQNRHDHLTDLLMISRLGYASACLSGVPAARADMASNLGIALGKVGLAAEAIELYRVAIDLHTRNDNTHAAAKAWNNLGNTLKVAGRREEAVHACRTAVDAYRRAGDSRKEAGAWINLGSALAADEQTENAVLAYEEAAGICRDIGDVENEVTARSRMADALLDAGRSADAVRVNRAAIAVGRAKRNVAAEAAAWSSLGFLFRRLGRAPEADDAYRRSIALEGGEEPTGTVALRWTHLGHARSQEGDYAGAAAAHREAVRAYHRIGDWHGEAMTSNNLGHVLTESGDPGGAAVAHQAALSLTRAHDDLFGQAMTLANIGVLHHRTGEPAAAGAAFREATGLFHRIGDAKREADAWLHLGICLHDHTRAEAIAAFRAALAVHTEANNKEGIAAATHWLVKVLVPSTLPSR